jgi:hypothetical protein
MSDTSFYSGLYQQIREYAELVDDVLIGLKEGTSSSSDASRQKLGEFLLNLANDCSDDLPTRLLVLVLQDKGGVASAEWSRIGNALLSSEVDNSVVEPLEKLACSLEQEQAGAMARIQGWSH